MKPTPREVADALVESDLDRDALLRAVRILRGAVAMIEEAIDTLRDATS